MHQYRDCLNIFILSYLVWTYQHIIQKPLLVHFQTFTINTNLIYYLYAGNVITVQLTLFIVGESSFHVMVHANLNSSVARLPQ